MHRTAARNGVLIYVSIEDRKLAVIGDVGVDAHVPATFWTQVVPTSPAIFARVAPGKA